MLCKEQLSNVGWSEQSQAYVFYGRIPVIERMAEANVISKLLRKPFFSSPETAIFGKTGKIISCG